VDQVKSSARVLLIAGAFWPWVTALTLSEAQPYSAHTQVERSVPDLPFPDNPDPDACGIPQLRGGEPAWLNGHYEGKLVQPVVFLYDSHVRREVTGRAPTGTKVKVILFQDNPTLNFYFVRTEGEDPQEGWVPAPFLRFEPLR
jgi:hypothetical protein